MSDYSIYESLFGNGYGDWVEAFSFATGFTIDDVEVVHAFSDGYNDGDAWIGVFKLRDGRWAFLTAGCDYTGWDCRAGGNSHTCNTLDELLLGYVGDENAKRLGLIMPK